MAEHLESGPHAEPSQSAADPARRPRLRNVFEAFSHRQYRRLWIGTVLLALANWAERLAIGAFVLDQTGSALLAAATFAVRNAPGLIAAPIAGAIADRVPRPMLLLVTALFKAGVMVMLGLTAIGGISSPWPILGLLVFSGIAHSFEVPSTQALITDVVPPRNAMNAISLQSTGARAVGALGAVASGVVSESLGAPPALFGAAFFAALGGVVVATVVAKRPTPVEVPVSVLKDAVSGLRMLIGMPVVGTLLWMAIIVEIFGFAYSAVLPAIARNALGVGEAGLGLLTAMGGLGALLGVAALTALGDFKRKGALLLAITLAYGAALILFSASPSFGMALVLIVGVGAMAASFDAMQWILLQSNVPAHMRGRAIGGWVFAIGFGWIGHLALGALTDLLGVRWAVGGAGLLVALVALVAYLISPRLRRI